MTIFDYSYALHLQVNDADSDAVYRAEFNPVFGFFICACIIYSITEYCWRITFRQNVTVSLRSVTV